MKIVGIYKITNKVNNKCYIGSSNNVKKRLTEHKRCLRLGKHHSIKLQRAYTKYGFENFSFDIIKECNENDLLKHEQEFFILLAPEYNILKIAGSFKGYKHTDETKEVLRQKRKNQIISPCSEETKQKISAANKNRIFSNAHKVKLSEAHLGKKLTEVHRRNIAKHCTTKIMSEKQKKSAEVRKLNGSYLVSNSTRDKISKANSVSVIGINDKNGIIYEFSSYREALIFLDISESTLWRKIKNNQKIKDLIWIRKTAFVP